MAITTTNNPSMACVLRSLQELEVLKCLECPQPLMDKVLQCIRKGQYRVMGMECDTAAEEPTNFATLVEAFQHVMLPRLFEDTDPIPFVSASNANLQSMLSGFDCDENEVIVKGAYVNKPQQRSLSKKARKECTVATIKDNEDDHILSSGPCAEEALLKLDNKLQNDENAGKKRKTALDNFDACTCASEFCQSADDVVRYFWVRDKTYCGLCLDEFFLLKLRFCFEHVARKGGSGPRDFSIQEEPPRGKLEVHSGLSMEQCEVEDDEFWVRLFFERNVYDYGEIRFVGVGSRLMED